jgi:hypothetical protein
MRTCKYCSQDKQFNEFFKNRRLKDGFDSICKLCRSAIKKQYRQDNLELIHSKELEYRKQNNETKRIKEWRNNNRDKQRNISKNYYKQNQDRCIKRGVDYTKKRRVEDIDFRLRHNISRRLNLALRNNQKSGSIINYLGCSIKDLKKYLESKFQKGMTWENYGNWHIDHIKPLSLFDLTDQNNLNEACHYSNLQPLWARDNLRKSNKYE